MSTSTVPSQGYGSEKHLSPTKNRVRLADYAVHLDNIRADALLMDMKLEVYPNDELGEYGDEKYGCKCSVRSWRKLSPLVRVPEDVSSEC